MTNSIKAVLFDLDDTLWPVNPVIEKAEATLHAWLSIHAPRVAQRFSISALRKRRLAMAEENPRYRIELRAVRQASLAEAFLESGEDGTKIEAAMAVFDQARNEVTLYDDVIPALTKLKSRYATGSISNGFADLDAIGIAHHFNVSIAAHRCGYAKPDAEIFHAACDTLKIKPSEAVYVGDDPESDIAGAQFAGLRAAWMVRGDLRPRKMPPHIQPDAILTDLHGLIGWLAP